MVTWSKFCTEDPQISGTSIQNVVTHVTWLLGLVHSRCNIKKKSGFICLRIWSSGRILWGGKKKRKKKNYLNFISHKGHHIA